MCYLIVFSAFNFPLEYRIRHRAKWMLEKRANPSRRNGNQVSSRIIEKHGLVGSTFSCPLWDMLVNSFERKSLTS